MFNKITLITSLLFFLLGTNALAQSHLKESTAKKSEVQSVVFQNNQTLETTTELTRVTNEIEATKGSVDAAFPDKLGPSLKEFVVPGVVGLVMIIGFGGYWLIYRRKHV
ncbi:MAG: hypothetical protein K6T88_05720 [Bacillus sp. (in: Bacteria)]|nr:hypothetical protein [Bacillus sp. (in: firmicutes)]